MFRLRRREQPVQGHNAAVETDDDQPKKEQLAALKKELTKAACYLTRSTEAADDLLQDTYVRAFSRLHQISAETPLKRWMWTIMKSIWFNELKKRRRRPEQELLDPDMTLDESFERRVEARIMVSDIGRACKWLSARDFALLMDIHAYGYTYREAAEELGEPINTVLSRGARAIAKVKRARDLLMDEDLSVQ